MDTLQTICIRSLANSIDKSEFKGYAKLIDDLPSGEKYKFQILPEPSNRIFDILTKAPLRFSFETANEISKVLNVTKVTLTSPIVNDASIDLLRSFNLEELRLSNLADENGWKILFGARKPFFDIIAALDSILNSKSCKKIRVLKIDGDHSVFNNDWIDQIANVLGPVLQQLDLSGCYLFRQNLACFPNLTELDVSYASISMKNGISQLNNLEKLSLAGIWLDDDDCEEIFKLRKLQFLNLSNFNPEPNLHFVEYSSLKKSNRPLPELKFLDISGFALHDLEMTQIARLVEVYPKLETIGLIRDGFPPNSNMAIPGVKLLMNTTIEECLDSIDYYLNNWGFQHKTIAPIIYGIHLEVGQTTYPEVGRTTYPEELMIQCLGKVIEAIDHGTKFNYIYGPFLTLKNLIDESRLRRISSSQRHSLARYLLAQPPRNERVFKYYFRLFQQCFTSDAFLASPYINYSMVYNITIDFVLRAISPGGDSYRQEALEMGMSISSKCLCKMSRSDETFRKRKFGGLCYYLMNDYEKRTRQAAAVILVHVFSFCTNRSMTEDQKVQLTTEIMYCVNEYSRDSDLDIQSVFCFIHKRSKSSAAKDWINWVLIN